MGLEDVVVAVARAQGLVGKGLAVLHEAGAPLIRHAGQVEHRHVLLRPEGIQASLQHERGARDVRAVEGVLLDLVEPRRIPSRGADEDERDVQVLRLLEPQPREFLGKRGQRLGPLLGEGGASQGQGREERHGAVAARIQDACGTGEASGGAGAGEGRERGEEQDALHRRAEATMPGRRRSSSRIVAAPRARACRTLGCEASWVLLTEIARARGRVCAM